jgi:hypothetical protein
LCRYLKSIHINVTADTIDANIFLRISNSIAISFQVRKQGIQSNWNALLGIGMMKMDDHSQCEYSA